MPYREVSMILDITIKTLEYYLDGTHLITMDEAYLFCKRFGGFEYMFQDMTNWQEELADKLKCGFRSPQPAVGGNSISGFDNFMPCIDKNVKAEKRIFEVDGDSMTGGKNNLEKGDLLETQLLRTFSDFKDFKPYVIDSDFDGLYVKELKAIRKNGKIIKFQCISDLETYYEPFEIIGSLHTKVYKVIELNKESIRIKLKGDIKKNRLKGVFRFLTDLTDIPFHILNNLVSLERRFNECCQLICTGIIENSLSKEMNTITVNLLSIIDEMAEEGLFKINLSK